MSARTCSSAPPCTNGTCASATTMRLMSAGVGTLSVQALSIELCGKPEIDDIAVLNDIFLAFEPHLAVFAADGHRAASDERVIGDDLGANESTLNVAVNFA